MDDDNEDDNDEEDDDLGGGGMCVCMSMCLCVLFILSHVKGVGRTKVMVTLASGSERIIEKDTNSGSESIQETDSQGGSRNTINSSSSQETVYSGGEDGNGEPYVTKELTPIVEGVVVVAEGGDDPVAVQNITEAVQALFEIDTHKIKVMKSN